MVYIRINNDRYVGNVIDVNKFSHVCSDKQQEPRTRTLRRNVKHKQKYQAHTWNQACHLAAATTMIVIGKDRAPILKAPITIIYEL